MSNKKDQCLISYAKNGRERYEDALDRNKTEAKKHFDGDALYYKIDLPEGCPSHQDTPYGFKPFLFADAFEKGFKQVLWLDSTIVMLRDPQPIFDVMSKHGVVAFHNLGHNLKNWISEKAIETTGIDLKQDPYQIMACVVGFDLDHPLGKKIFDKWLALSQDGVSFQNNPCANPNNKHRHDQAVLSALLWQEKVSLLSYGSLVYETHYPQGYEGKTPYFLNKAI